MKGICFIEPLFEKVVSGAKTETRRIASTSQNEKYSQDYFDRMLAKAKYRIGDIVYLKEPYIDDYSMEEIIYRYMNNDLELIAEAYGWKNKLFMPASSARFFIKIAKVAFERLQDITFDECMKEGIKRYGVFSYGNTIDKYRRFQTPKEAYADLIDKINGKGTWASNPFVYVYGFDLIKNNN